MFTRFHDVPENGSDVILVVSGLAASQTNPISQHENLAWLSAVHARNVCARVVHGSTECTVSARPSRIVIRDDTSKLDSFKTNPHIAAVTDYSCH